MKKMYIVESYYDWDREDAAFSFENNVLVTDDLDLGIEEANKIFQERYDSDGLEGDIVKPLRISPEDSCMYAIYTSTDDGTLWQVTVSEIKFLTSSNNSKN